MRMAGTFDGFSAFDTFLAAFAPGYLLVKDINRVLKPTSSPVASTRTTANTYAGVKTYPQDATVYDTEPTPSPVSYPSTAPASFLKQGLLVTVLIGGAAYLILKKKHAYK